MSKYKLMSGLIGLLLTASFLIAGCSQAATPTPVASPTPTLTVTQTLTQTASPTPTRRAAVAIDTRSLGNGTVGVAYSQKLQASGGSAPYTWALSGGAFPAGLNLNSGAVSGTPTASGTFSFTAQATDTTGASATANLSITIQRVTPIISTATLPGGKVGTAYAQTLAATDGVPPYSWSITDGALPGGLTLNAGAIAGTPTTAGSFKFSLQLSDNAGSTAKTSLSIDIQSVPVFSTTTLPAGEVNAAYSQALTVSGGSTPYVWVITAGTLPGGLTLSNAAISGTPTASGTFNFGLQISDTAGLTASATFSIVIAPAPSVTTNALPGGKAGLAYSQTLAASGGTAPYSWSVTSGSLPGGLTLATGVISGTPTTAGVFSFAIQAVDSLNVAAAATLSISITTAPSITTTTLSAGEAGVAYSQTLAASGGVSPYTWSITSGTLPGGLSLSAGAISGTPTTAGAFSFVLQAADSTNTTATASLSINIATVPIITTTSLPTGKAGTAYSQTLTASGGISPYNWSMTGTPPAGLSLNAGVISGTPTAAGTFSIAVQVTDGAGATITANLAITITN